MKKICVIIAVGMLIGTTTLLSGCMDSNNSEDYVTTSYSGVVVDVDKTHRAGTENTRDATVIFDDDMILKFMSGNVSAYELWFFCKNHIGDEIYLKYSYWVDKPSWQYIDFFEVLE